MPDLTCVQKLADARNALHLLMTGAKEASITYENRTITYRSMASGDIDRLRAYIRDLEATCGGPDGTPGTTARAFFNVRFS